MSSSFPPPDTYRLSAAAVAARYSQGQVQGQGRAPLPAVVQSVRPLMPAASSEPVGPPAGPSYYNSVGRVGPPPPLLYVSSAAAAVHGAGDMVAEALNSSSSESSTCGAAAYGGAAFVSSAAGGPPTRRSREFIPESKKDDEYWMKRQKNNEAAKRSREKRRANDAVMSRRVHELVAENKRLRIELDSLRRQLGIPTSDQGHGHAHRHRSAPGVPGLATTGDRTLRSPPQRERRDVERGPNYEPVIAVTTRREYAAPVLESYYPGALPQRLGNVELPLYRHGIAPAAGQLVSPRTPGSSGGGIRVSTTSSGGDIVDVHERFHHAAAGGVATFASTSDTRLPSIANLCSGSAAAAQRSDARLDSGAATWTRRLSTDSDLSTASGRLALPLPPAASSPRLSTAAAAAAPIVIFSDVSSSGDESVDELTFMPSAMDVIELPAARTGDPTDNGAERHRADEVPLNLSTPSRRGSPATVLRLDLAAVPQPSAGSSEFGEVESHASVRVLTEAQRRPATVEAVDSLTASPDDVATQHALSSSRSTSLSSVASAAAVWHDDVTAAADQQSAGVGRQVPCGLPLKVRRKLQSSGGVSALPQRRTSSDAATAVNLPQRSEVADPTSAPITWRLPERVGQTSPDWSRSSSEAAAEAARQQQQLMQQQQQRRRYDDN